MRRAERTNIESSPTSAESHHKTPVSRGLVSCLCAVVGLAGCAGTTEISTRRPAEEYVARMRAESPQARTAAQSPGYQGAGFQSMGTRPTLTQPSYVPTSGRTASAGHPEGMRARLRLAGGEPFLDSDVPARGGSRDQGLVTNLGGQGDFLSFDSDMPGGSETIPVREYRGPLNLGDPGVSASLWKESRGGNNLFRDYRASQPMDLITIVVDESLTGKKEGTTTVTQESSFTAALRNLFGLENSDRVRDSGDSTDTRTGGADLSNLARGSITSDFKGDGETERKGTLRGRISAMVAEVLPSGVMRIEGEKIISLNSEEEVMVISGLVRPEDVSSDNEVQSSKLANVRIDYYGNGTVGDAQRGGWLGRVLRRWWPF